MSNLDLDQLRAELDEFSQPKTGGSSRTHREERIIAGFEDIERFFELNGRLPRHGENNDIFERLYAVRLDKIRSSEECLSVLQGFDKYNLVQVNTAENNSSINNLDDDDILQELSGLSAGENDITKLKHVRPRAEIKPAEEIAQRSPCHDFAAFKPLFVKVQNELNSGIRKAIEFKDNAQIVKGKFFILGGQKVYVAEVGEEIKAPNGSTDARLRVVYDNGTESNLLRRSLQRALHKDEAGRRITEVSAGPLFSDEIEEDDTDSGTIYVLRSKSEHPLIQEHRDVIHKIGVTGIEVKKRIANAKLDPTFLMADVEIVSTYNLSNISRVKLENLIHKFFEPARLKIEIKDRFGNPIEPREWFLTPLFVINDAIEKIKDGTIVDYYYDEKTGAVVKRL